MNEVYPGLWGETLATGLEVLVEPMPHHQSAAVGLFVKAGSREDPPGKEGLAHLLEHVTFKGTRRRSSQEIAQVIDLLGGHLNAATTLEFTAFHTEVLADGLPEALGVLRELALEPRLAPDDIRREQIVIAEEIRTLDDDPEDQAFRQLGQTLWANGHPLGRPVAGESTSIGAIEPQDVQRFFVHHYRPDRMVLVAAGRVEAELVRALGEKFAGQTRTGGDEGRSPPTPGPGMAVVEKDLQQVHLALGFPTVPIHAKERYALEVLNGVLGGGVSSRLFQRVREELALAYAVFSANAFHSDAGALVIYGATEEAKVARLLEAIWAEVEALRRAPPGGEELDRAVRRLQNAFRLGLDDPSNRVMRLGGARALGLRPASPEEVVNRLGQVTAEEVQDLACRFLRPSAAAMGVVGPVGARLERVVRGWVEVGS